MQVFTEQGIIMLRCIHCQYVTNGVIINDDKLSRFIFNKNGDTLVELDQDNAAISRFIRGYDLVAVDVDNGNEISKRLLYMGKTPSKKSTAGKKVIELMNNEKNYLLEHRKYNRRDGAKLRNPDGTRMTYDPPECDGKENSFK